MGPLCSVAIRLRRACSRLWPDGDCLQSMAHEQISQIDEHQRWMRHALRLAQTAYACSEVPVGAVVVMGDDVIGEGYNRTLLDCDPSAHAEIVALRAAAKAAGNHRLPAARLYSTIEPCAMCAGAILQARIKLLVFGATDAKAGAVSSVMNLLQNPALNHRCDVIGGVLRDESAAIIQAFFAAKRHSRN